MATKKRANRPVTSPDKCRRFAVAYMRLGNASLAYRSILANPDGPNPNTAKKAGHELLHDERTQAALRTLRAKVAERAETSLAEWLANELRIARFDMARMFDEDGNLLALSDMDPDTRAAIQSIEIEEERFEKTTENGEPGVLRTRVKKIRVHSKDGAQERLGKHLGAYREDNKQRNPYEELLALMHGKT